MYSMVLMAALTTGTATPDFGHWHGCHGCCGGCYGCWGGYGCHGCWGGYGCHGCWGGGGLFHHGWGHGCHGCWGGWGHGCYGCHGCYGGTGYVSACCGCCGGYAGCAGCAGCAGYGGGIVDVQAVPPMMPAAPPEQVAPEKVPAAPKKTTSTQMERAQVVVELPGGAKLYVDGNPVKAGAAKRTFNTPPLEQGQAYYYMFRAEVVRDGQTLDETTRVIVRAGEVARASFPTLETSTATASSR